MVHRPRLLSEAVKVPVKRGDDTRPSLRPTAAQKKYLSLGLDQPGGKLPLFDRLHRQGLGGTLVRQSDETRLAGLQADAGRICRARQVRPGRNPQGVGIAPKTSLTIN